MLAHYMFTLRCNPSDAVAIAALNTANVQSYVPSAGAAAENGDEDSDGDEELLSQQPPTLRMTTSSSERESTLDVTPSPPPSPVRRRITVEQIKSAREEAIKQERAWSKAIGQSQR